jgi:hypothetical protein
MKKVEERVEMRLGINRSNSKTSQTLSQMVINEGVV